MGFALFKNLTLNILTSMHGYQIKKYYVKTIHMNDRFKFSLYIKVTLLLGSILILHSCKSKEIIIPALHEEIYEVNTYVANDDLEGLIQLYPSLLVHKDYAYHSIFCDFDYQKYNYEQLLKLYNKVQKDTLLQEGFEAILEQKENVIIDNLINQPIDEVAEYYFDHPFQHCFLNTFIEECIISNMEKMDYFEIKYIANIFKNSIFYDRLQKQRMKLKNSMSKEIKKNIKNYIKAEYESLNYLELSIRTYITTYLYEKFPLVINDIIDKDLPEDKNEITTLTESLINKHISNYHINNYIKNETERYVNEINNVRKQTLLSVALEHFPSNNYLLQNSQNYKYLNIKYNPQPLYEISKIQNEIDGIGVALSIASFFGSFIPGGIILDALDLGYGIRSEKKRSEKQIPHIKAFSEDFRIKMEKAADNYINDILKDLYTNFNKSQKTFSTIYYELY